MDRQIWFVRHAQSEYNKKKLFTGWHDPELTQHGIHIAHELKEELYGIKFNQVYSSPLKRALSTAKILIDDQEIIVDDRLNKISIKIKNIQNNSFSIIDAIEKLDLVKSRSEIKRLIKSSGVKVNDLNYNEIDFSLNNHINNNYIKISVGKKKVGIVNLIK